MRRLFTFIILLVAATAAKAQSGRQLSLSVVGEANFPFNTNNYYYGHIRDYYKNGLGTDVKLEVPLTASLHLTTSAGFAWYSAQLHYIAIPLAYNPNAGNTDYVQTGGITSYKFLPLKAGFRYYFMKYLYAGAEAGDAIKLNSNSLSAFVWSAEAGLAEPIDKHNGIGLGVQYARGIKSYYYPAAMSQFSILIAYKYSF